MRDLILGLGNLRFEEMEPFLASLKQTSFNGDVCFFAYDLHAATLDQARLHGIRIEDGRRFTGKNRHIMNSRFLMFLDFVSRYSNKYDRVMLTDVRDVIFQSNPFLAIGNEEVRFACEQARIKECPINGAWLYQAYGYGVLENLRDYLISCAGTSIGTTGGILRYLTVLVDEMTKCEILNINIDQGIHNYVLRMRPIRRALVDVNDVVVATLEHMSPERLSVTSDGVAVDGRVPPVIHQWDRRPAVREHVLSHARFRIPSVVSPVRSASPRSDAYPIAEGFSPPYFGPAAHRPRIVRKHPLRERAVLAFVSAADVPEVEGFLRSVRTQPHSPTIILCSLATTSIDAEMTASFGAEIVSYVFAKEYDSTNVAHLCIHQALQAMPGREVVVLENVRCRMQADVWQYIAANVSLCAEGCKRVADCTLNFGWMSYFGELNDNLTANQIISSEVVAGETCKVLTFYDEVVSLLSKRPDLMEVTKLAQGAFNWVAAGRPEAHTIHPNGSLAFLNFWPSEMTIENDAALRVGGAVPAIVLHP